MSEVSGENSAEKHQRMQADVDHLANIFQKGMARGLFVPRNHSLAAVNTLCIFFQSGKLMDPDLRDRIVETLLVAAVGYLKKRCQLWRAFDKFSDPKPSGRIGECGFRPS